MTAHGIFNNNKDINDFMPDHIISFNYSNTYERIYDVDVTIDHIHGKAKKIDELKELEKLKFLSDTDIFREKNNIVLGIDEYRDTKNCEKNKNTDLLFTRKYFQRIFKQTEIGYKKILNMLDEEYYISGNKDLLDVMIFGHSLDNTDGDILRELINKPYSHIKIMYYSKKDQAEKMKNLVSVLGAENFIEKCNRVYPQIEFVLQSSALDIENNDFQVKSDINRILNAMNLSSKDVINRLNNVASNIELKNKEYFVNQENVVTVFYALNKHGLLDEKLKKELLEIAKKLPKEQNGAESELLDPECWAEYDYISSQLLCNENVKNFINNINKENEKNYTVNVRESMLSENLVKSYLKSIPRNISRGEYEELINACFLMYDEDNVSNKIINSLLKKVSLGAAYSYAREVLESKYKEINNSEDSQRVYKTIVINTIISDIDYKNEYEGYILG